MATTHRARSRGPDREPRKAGRDLPAAIGVGAGLGGLVVAGLFTYRVIFVAILTVAVLIAVWELCVSLNKVQARPPIAPLAIGGIALQAVAWLKGSEALAITFLLTCAAVAIWRLAEGPNGYLRDVSTGMLIALYVPFLAGFAVLMAVPDDGAKRVIAFVVTVVCSDVGGYATGVFLGRHPMAPSVSPGKSWEGFAGSVVACAVAGILLLTLVFHEPAWEGAVFGVALAITASLGDLGESLLKRDLGVKDMGTTLPGHGGVMDRLDSLLPGALVAYLLLSAFMS